MSFYIKRGNGAFRIARNGEYVDKSGLISVINSTLETERYCSCVTRSRRFGKSMAAQMLCAYYDESCDSRELFADLSVASEPSFEKHLNRYPVIYVDITDFTTRYRNEPDIVSRIESAVRKDVLSAYKELSVDEDDDLMAVLMRAHLSTGQKFIIIIDEWDAVLREYEKNDGVVESYVDLLRHLFKGSASKDVFAGAYLTGILPIKKYRTESALNNFREYSMVSPGPLAGCFGFTRPEVEMLCEEHRMSFEEMASWYDGYKIGDVPSVFNPYSVMEAIANRRYRSYWSSTGAYDSVRTYIQMNFDGLKDDVIKMLAGGRCRVNTTRFQNDMSIVCSRDDVLTVLIHLGYLSYDWEMKECYIPNKEVGEELTNAVEDTSWTRLSDALQASADLLDATLSCNTDTVARGIDLAHDENTSILSYNDENSLSCVLSIAYYYARNNYIFHREYASGKGYADLVLIPRRNVDSPALVIELKFDKAVDTAIDQIKSRNYPEKVAEYTGDILLVGVSYDRESKTHSCRIERFVKA